MSRPEGVDHAEARARLRRQRRRHRGVRYFDLSEREFTDEERAEKFGAVFETCWRGGMSRQAVLNMIGQAAHREGKSFDESVEAYHVLYVRGGMRRRAR